MTRTGDCGRAGRTAVVERTSGVSDVEDGVTGEAKVSVRMLVSNPLMIGTVV